MPLHVPPAPAPALRSIRAALRSPAALRSAPAPALVQPAANPPQSQLPLPVYEMPCRGGVLDRAGTRLTGWRFPLYDGSDAGHEGAEQDAAADGDRGRVGDGGDRGGRGDRGSAAATGSPVAAEAMLTADGWAFAGFRTGPYVLAAQRALRQAESVPGGHQPRLLSVPQLYMLTLWLHADAGADADADDAAGTPGAADLLIPLAPAPPGIASHTPHRVDALLPALSRRVAAASLLAGTG